MTNLDHKKNVIETAHNLASKFPPKQAVAFLKGMAAVKPNSETSKELLQIAEKYAKSA